MANKGNNMAAVPQSTYNKKLLVLAGILAIILVILGGLYLMKNDKLDNVAKQETPQFAVNTNPVVQTELPKGFPKDLPTEKDAKVLKNSESTTTDGRVQSSRTVTTSRTLEQATKVYVDFFTKQGWKVVSSQGNLTMMLKGDDSLLIEAKAGADENTISLNLTQAQSN